MQGGIIQIMTEIERVLNKPISREEERYSMKRSDLDFLYRTAKGGQFHMAFIAFRYGFEKGRRCERAKRRREETRYTITPDGIDYLEGMEAFSNAGE